MIYGFVLTLRLVQEEQRWCPKADQSLTEACKIISAQVWQVWQGLLAGYKGINSCLLGGQPSIGSAQIKTEWTQSCKKIANRLQEPV